MLHHNTLKKKDRTGRLAHRSHRLAVASVSLADLLLQVLEMQVHGLDDKPAIVLEFGGSLIKCGFAGEGKPRCIVRTPRCLLTQTNDSSIEPVRASGTLRSRIRILSSEHRLLVIPSSP